METIVWLVACCDPRTASVEVQWGSFDWLHCEFSSLHVPSKTGPKHGFKSYCCVSRCHSDWCCCISVSSFGFIKQSGLIFSNSCCVELQLAEINFNFLQCDWTHNPTSPKKQKKTKHSCGQVGSCAFAPLSNNNLTLQDRVVLRGQCVAGTTFLRRLSGGVISHVQSSPIISILVVVSSKPANSSTEAKGRKLFISTQRFATSAPIV